MFNTVLKSLREERRITQEAFAKELGVSQSTIGNWESGNREPNFDTVQKIADFFNVSVDYMIGHPISSKTAELTEQEEKEYRNITEKAKALFFDDEISERDKETIYKNITDAFWEAREMNRRENK